MRSTMHNNSYFQKLLNNVQNSGVKIIEQKKKNSSNNVEAHIPDNINVMIKTSQGGFHVPSHSVNNSSGGYVINTAHQNSVLHSNVISKALA